MMRCLVLLVVLLVLGSPAQAAGITVDARPDRVVWSGVPAGCVYWIGSGRERVRLGCSRNGNYTPLNGDLYTGDLVEVRYPTPAGVLTGRAIVQGE